MNCLLERVKSVMLGLAVTTARDTAVSLSKDYPSIGISGSMAAYVLSKS